MQEIHLLVASHTSPNVDLPYNPGTCPDWESKWDLSVCRLALNPLSRTSQFCNPPLFYRSPVGVLVRDDEREVFYDSVNRFPILSGPVFMDSDLHKY